MATTTKQAYRRDQDGSVEGDEGNEEGHLPAKAIGDAAAGLEHDIVAALRQELKHLKKTVATIQKDLRCARPRRGPHSGTVADSAPSANGRATSSAKKPAAKKTTAKKPAAKKTAAKKAGAATGRSK